MPVLTEPHPNNDCELKSVRDLFRLNDGVVMAEKEVSHEVLLPQITGPTNCELSHSGIQDFIEEWIPSSAVSVIGRIEFRPLAGHEKDTDIDRIGYATYSPSRNESYIAIASDVLGKWAYEVRSQGEGDEQIQKEILMTLAHEYGHALHYVAPPESLQEWLGARGDGIAGPESAYYRTTGKDVSEQEDFAETFALYVCDPDRLYELSESAYSAMENLLARLD